MPKICTPRRLSREFDISKKQLDELGIIDVFLNIDTRLFIDPLLLAKSRVPEMREAAVTYERHFRDVARLIMASKSADDAAWRAARRKIQFSEVAATCLGYGATTAGSGIGQKLRIQLMSTAREILAAGVTDPYLFSLIGLLEENIGPDRISDMTTNVIVAHLAAFTERMSRKLEIPVVEHKLAGQKYHLPSNQTARGSKPLLFVPTDVVRPLPVASDWNAVSDVISYNEELRSRINGQIAKIWKALARKANAKVTKADIRKVMLLDGSATEELLKTLRDSDSYRYDTRIDPDALFRWYDVGREVAGEEPLALSGPAAGENNCEWASRIVAKIVQKFRDLVENKGVSRLLYKDDGTTPQHEKFSQLVFFTVADCYCQANDLNISPEVDTGSGKIDFVFSKGYALRIAVEIKLSRNTNIVDGYKKQLAAYVKSLDACEAFYVVIDVGRMGKKREALKKVYDAALAQGTRTPRIEDIDARPRPSASKLRST